jgi:hypothetical protein
MSLNIKEQSEKIKKDVENNIFNKADELTILLLCQNAILEEIRDILKGEPNARRKSESEQPKLQRRRTKPRAKRKPYSTRPGWKPPELEGDTPTGTESGKDV